MTPAERPALAITTVVRAIGRDFAAAWRALLVFEVAFKLAEAWLLVPAVALVLRTILAQGGRFVVSNHEILNFLWTPWGLFYAVLFGAMAIAARLIEQAGIMLVATWAATGRRPALSQFVGDLSRAFVNIAKLGVFKLLGLAFTFSPFVVLAVLTYAVLLTKHDIYFYWQDRPPVFWLAVTIGAVLLLCAGALGTWLYVRWSLALPIVLFEQKFAHTALRTSRQRLAGHAWSIAGYLLGWQMLAILLTALASGLYRQIALLMIGSATERPSWLILLLLVVQAAILAVVSFVIVVGQALLTRRLYLKLSPTDSSANDSEDTNTAVAGQSPWRWVILVLAFVLISPVGIWIGLTQTKAQVHWVLITAHRGHARAAPENTLAAIRKAIESGADYAEIDVQLTADGEVVLLHDRDFKRVSGDGRRLADLDLAEVQQFDVGTWFSPQFAHERVPTLAEVIDLARGRIKLNIELKFYGPDQGLSAAVARVVSEHNFHDNCLITSFNYEALQAIRQQHPRQRVGLIIAHSIGDLGRLQVDAWSVRADHLSDDILRSAYRLQREVHVWGVNDRAAMARWIWAGVDNLITSDPDLAIEVRKQWADASEAEQLLQASRLLLGI